MLDDVLAESLEMLRRGELIPHFQFVVETMSPFMRPTHQVAIVFTAPSDPTHLPCRPGDYINIYEVDSDWHGLAQDWATTPQSPTHTGAIPATCCILIGVEAPRGGLVVNPDGSPSVPGPGSASIVRIVAFNTTNRQSRVLFTQMLNTALDSFR